MGFLHRLRPRRDLAWPVVYRGGLPSVLGTGDGMLRIRDGWLEFRFLYRPQQFRLPLAGADSRVDHYPTPHGSSTFVPAPTHPSTPMLVFTPAGDGGLKARFQTPAADEILKAIEQERQPAGGR